MSRRNNKYSGKRGGKGHNQGSSIKNDYVDQSVTKEELAEEAIFAFTLLRESDSNLSQPSEKYCYVLSYQWYTIWKDYVSYDEVIDGKPYKRSMGVRNPGFINKNLLDETTGEAYFKLPKEMSKGEFRYLEMWITKKVIDKDDYITVDYRMWEFFERKYGGYCVPRPIYFSENSCSNYNDVDLQAVHILILQEKMFEHLREAPNEEEALRKRIIPYFKKIQLNSYWCMTELNSFLRTVVSESEYNKKVDADCININIWQPSHFLSQDQIRKSIASYVLKAKKGIPAEPLPFRDMMDSSFENKFLMNLYKPHRYLVVECKTEEEEWNLQGEYREPDHKAKEFKGFCEYCNEKNLLALSCVCREFFYCCERCKYRDQNFHLKICSRAYDSDSDEEEAQEEEQKQGDAIEVKSNGSDFFYNTLRGLKNIGNTCYMNSALQCLRCMPEFWAIFVQKKYLEVMKKKQKSENNFMLLKKASKLWKEFSYDDENPVEPWAFKQIMGYYFPGFKGWMQHDSQEFISYLLNGLHEELTENLEKEQDEAPLNLNKAEDYYALCLRNGFSPIYKNFLGLYRSEISCSHCNYSSPQFDSFLTVSLDLFQKPEEAVLEVFLVYSKLLKAPKKLLILVRPEIESLADIEQRVMDAGGLDSDKCQLVFTSYDDKTEQIFYNNSINLKELENKHGGKGKRLICYEVEKLDIADLVREEEEAKSKQESLEIKSEKEPEEESKPEAHWSDYYFCVPISFLTKFMVPGVGLIKRNFSFPRLLVLKKTDKPRSLHIKILEMIDILYPDLFAQAIEIVNAEKIKELESKNEPESQVPKEKPAKIEKSPKPEERPQSAASSSRSNTSKMKESGGNWKTRGSPQGGKAGHNQGREKKEAKETKAAAPQEQGEEKEDVLKNYFDNFPYKVRFINQAKRGCVFCKKKSCDNCEVDILSEEALGELQKKAEAEGIFQIQVFWEKEHPEILGQIELEKKEDRASSKGDKPNVTTLLECIEYSSKPELLTEGNRWNCPECKEPRDAGKRILLECTPKYLIFHLKRFKSLGKGKREKNPQLINYPINQLDLRKMVNGVTPELLKKGYKEPVYDLIGVVCHEGTLDNGHYYSYCRTETEKWTKFDDSKVTDPVDEGEVYSKHAYILFYKIKKLS